MFVQGHYQESAQVYEDEKQKQNSKEWINHHITCYRREKVE